MRDLPQDQVSQSTSSAVSILTQPYLEEALHLLPGLETALAPSGTSKAMLPAAELPRAALPPANAFCWPTTMWTSRLRPQAA